MVPNMGMECANTPPTSPLKRTYTQTKRKEYALALEVVNEMKVYVVNISAKNP